MKTDEVNSHNSIVKYLCESSRDDIIARIDALINQLEIAENARAQLKDDLDRYKADARKCANQELINETNRLKAELSLCYGSYKFDTEKELKAFKAFENEHIHCSKTKVDSAKLPYIVSSACGFGISKTAVCRICGKTKNITDIDAW